MCSKWECTARHWKCGNNQQCIRQDEVCDGKMVCNDKADEDPAMCSTYINGSCLAGHWKCRHDRLCIPEKYVCDGKTTKSCIDKSDEDPLFCARWNCIDGYWKCKDGLQCINKRYVCDGDKGESCNDKSDEDHSMCLKWNCISGYTSCADNLQCINKAFICDKIVNCNDGSDELCGDTCLKLPLLPGEKTIIKRCPKDSSVCIKMEQYCDGIAQCPDGGDETLSNCTCEDWGLGSCKTDNKDLHMKCLNTKWLPPDTLNRSTLNCLESHSIDGLIQNIKGRRG